MSPSFSTSDKKRRMPEVFPPRSFCTFAAAACFAFSPFVTMADNTVPDVVSSVVSYRYVEEFSNAALTNGSIVSSIVSYRYLDWPGDDVLHLQSSPWVSYYYQFLDAPPLSILPTSRLATVAETTPATLFPPPSQSQLKVFEGGV